MCTKKYTYMHIICPVVSSAKITDCANIPYIAALQFIAFHGFILFIVVGTNKIMSFKT